MIYNYDLLHDIECDCNQDALFVQGERLLRNYKQFIDMMNAQA